MMIFWIFLLTLIPFTCGQIRETEYECGAHGKFEYCIDGVPGCVVGCHCHPGYYFDTDTKICEPNIKLTQNFRRNYDIVEPTRIYLPATPSVVEPATTARTAVDEKIDIITKDADDLGDWLYNQFFKTIENQVINETKDDTLISRRSNVPEPPKVPTRRSHKYWKAKRRRKKKKKGLKSKLLRITEDDSLFDSSSSSSSEESSDSSSSSDVSKDYSNKNRREKRPDHGKKLIMYNKRPKPPLPSFIFLPNMDTPFFPPIGLPPPIPMYPMVPVPPVPVPPYPYQVQPPPTDAATTTTDAATTTTDAATTATDAAITEPATAIHTTAAKVTKKDDEEGHQEEKEPEQNEEKEANEGNEENTEANAENATEETPARLRNRKKPRKGPRNKLMQKLRNKFKRKNKLQKYLLKEYLGTETPDTVDDDVSNMYHPNAFSQMNIKDALPPGLQDIDFKYLSQLIHRANLNATNLNPTLPAHVTESFKNMTLPSAPSRRYYNNNPDQLAHVLDNLANQQVNQIPIQPAYDVPIQRVPNVPYRKKIEDTNDVYYANLGRQIASMIRNAEGDKDVDIEISQSSYPSDPVFARHSGSRSYWERSVRSPLKNLRSFKKEMNNLKHSNEDLFSLENKAQMAASTVPTLSLQEIENIISKVERAKKKLITRRVNSKYNTKSSKTSFNVNLLLGNYQPFHSQVHVKKTTQEVPKYENRLIGNMTQTRRDNNELPKPKNKNSLLADFLFSVQELVQNNNKTILKPDTIIPTLRPIGKTRIGAIPPYNLSKKYFTPYSYNAIQVNAKPPFLPNMLPTLQVATSIPEYYPLNPRRQNLTRWNNNYYHTDHNNEFSLEAASMPIKFPTLSSHNNPVALVSIPHPTSYFDKMNHFDYFDERFPNGWL